MEILIALVAAVVLTTVYAVAMWIDTRGRAINGRRVAAPD
jgi:hypothetical protein